MIKGCQKKIIQVKDTKSPFFEEAYFVLKSSIDTSLNEKIDIVSEATSIINRYSPNISTNGPYRRKFRLIFFILGAVFGGISMTLISFLFM